MKRFTQLLTISFFFAGLTACGGASDEAPDARYWKKVDRETRLAAQPLRQLHRLGPDALPGETDDDVILADGRGLRDGRGNGYRRGLRDGRRGLRDGTGPRNYRAGERRGFRDGYRRGLRDGSGGGRGRGGAGRPDVGRGRGGANRLGTGRHLGPPAEALAACENKAEGDACSFVIEGETVTSTCKLSPSGKPPLSCRAGHRTHHRRTTPAK